MDRQTAHTKRKRLGEIAGDLRDAAAQTSNKDFVALFLRMAAELEAATERLGNHYIRLVASPK